MQYAYEAGTTSVRSNQRVQEETTLPIRVIDQLTFVPEIWDPELLDMGSISCLHLPAVDLLTNRGAA